ncbi:MAG: D-arabinose 5-phosphate isomerase [Candidatus Firestonebacteria bacterium RIFOXYC2_FULL_39_67]|nr:MAG: D-arabinose 5-phosphate isomerase [Candidatus Firestonebacteria bacterium RIFOXYD2_FULL_39_29]OGF52559.1 MAG: D-arabinose 5-phosphate isomerase [Candidatus Firestonebacteria bacterium RifOxyC12_full_39_7]OGF55018.1 MAG: D-arabinose 5-phosphate isomerase [Candidatus Firestonebacteria bacterium RIFOXYC2_FULL_39_67]
MVNNKYLIKKAKEVLRIESGSVLALTKSIDKNFIKAVDLLYKCRGRVIVTGIGKSGIIARKISATMASTGTPALFLHSAEGLHGDLGTVLSSDVVIALSQSGESKELLEILPAIKKIGAKLIALTGDMESELAKSSNISLNVEVKEEACPLGLAPTASSMAQLAMGDALAVVLLIKRGFNKQDYALLHPGGSLGRKLKKVEDIMRKGNELPVVCENVNMRKVIYEMTSKKMGCTSVVDKRGRLTGIITDQNLRTHLTLDRNIMQKKARDIMTKNPRTICKDALVDEAVRMTEVKSISTLLVTGKTDRLVGIIHLHDLLKLSR